MRKILIICGPTATGKTAIALKLAKKYNGEIVSADSRQIFIGLNALTGKDLPGKIKRQRSNVRIKYRSKTYQPEFYKINGNRLWMYDVVEPGEDFSVAHYQVLANGIVKDILVRGKLPILVGGTGLYLKSFTTDLSLVNIPPDPDLRSKLSEFNVNDLQEELRLIDSLKWGQMNNSDRNNPRRLVRAIEIAHWIKKHKENKRNKPLKSDVLWIGLSGPREVLKQKISEKIVKRWRNAVSEIKALKKDPAILGVVPVRDYLSRRLTKAEALSAWITGEYRYAKRQVTWFKKQPGINWFDITQTGCEEKVNNLLQKWYTK